MKKNFKNTNLPIDDERLRLALGHFLTGLTIVTVTNSDGLPYGLTVNSFNSVSLSPPLILWSLDRRNEHLKIFQDARGFAVNIMASTQVQLCERFANSDQERFTNCDWSYGKFGQPVLNGSLVNMECKQWAEYDGGDHCIFVGEVQSIKIGGGMPIAFYQGKISEYKPSE